MAVVHGLPAHPVASGMVAATIDMARRLLAQSEVCARTFAAQAQANDSTLQTALAYLDLLRAEQEVAIAREAQENTLKLQKLTAVYAKSGQGQQADDDRALRIRLASWQEGYDRVALWPP